MNSHQPFLSDLVPSGNIRDTMPVDATHLVSLFENATEGIILTNGIGGIVLVNPAAERIFGYNAAELIGKPIEVLVPEKVKPHHKAMREGFYQNPSNRQMGHGRDLQGRKKDGSAIPLEVSLSYYKRQEEGFVIAFIVDITERKKHEESIFRQQTELEKLTHSMRRLNTELEAKVEERTLILKEALQKLEESQKDLSESLDKEKQLNEIKSRFVSMASHEFRTPLSTILSSATLLSKYTTTEDQDKRDKHVDKIRNSVKHLNDLLEDFLSLGKLDEGRIETNPGEFNLAETIHDLVEEMKTLIKPGQRIEVSIEGPPIIITDKKLLRNILINLLSNAIKFSEENKPIYLTCQTLADGLHVIVADEGIGIPLEDQQHLFSSFYRARNALNIQGTGLGLHIIRRYLDLLDGTISVESEIGRGSKFHLFIPKTPNDLA